MTLKSRPTNSNQHCTDQIKTDTDILLL